MPIAIYREGWNQMTSILSKVRIYVTSILSKGKARETIRLGFT